MSRLTTLLVLSGLVFAPGAATLQPADARAGQQAADSASDIERLDEGEARLVTRMASRLDVDASELIAWRERGLGWGDIEMAMLLSARSGQSVERVVERWKAHDRRWQPVGDEFGIADVEALMAESRGED